MAPNGLHVRYGERSWHLTADEQTVIAAILALCRASFRAQIKVTRTGEFSFGVGPRPAMALTYKSTVPVENDD